MDQSIDIVIPVLNEEEALPKSIAYLHSFLVENLEVRWRIVIADNGSKDSTPLVSKNLMKQYPELSYIRLEQRGRGRALRKAWLESKATMVCYMDVDLSTKLQALPLLVRALQSGYHIAIGSRLMPGASVHLRSLKREFISQSYNTLIRTMFFTRFKDAQCGFKAMTRETAQVLVPVISDSGWFFDSELLLLAEKGGFSIKDVPVEWTDDPDSRVRVFKTAVDDLKGLFRLRTGGLYKALNSTKS